MQKIIESNSLLEDIVSKKARNNFDSMVSYLCSKLVFKNYEDKIALVNNTLEENHQYVASILYSEENQQLIGKILRERTEINDGGMVDGYSWIYDLNRPILVEVDSRRFFESVAALEHELIHVVSALNGNNPKTQYNEVLSFFGEFVVLDILSQREGNPDIYNNAMINRTVMRMSYRVFAKNFEDKSLKKSSEFSRKNLFAAYPYMLGFIYAIRLLDIYRLCPEELLEKFNKVLSGEITIDTLLNYYNISLEDESTYLSFIGFCDEYESVVLEKHDKTDLHYVR